MILAKPNTILRNAGWQKIAPGFEMQRAQPNANPLSTLMMLRIDPNRYEFRVHYEAPMRLGKWQERLPYAAVILNASFYDKVGKALGLLSSDGRIEGTPITERGGLFAVKNGTPIIRYNPEMRYNGEDYEQAVQAFPMLVHRGEQLYTQHRGDRMTRRSAIAMDRCGRVILISTPRLGLHLADLAAFLTQLHVVEAFNLDGGGSTMMAVPDAGVSIPSLDPVPTVLAVYAH
jgi:exopolysaccharide biosynthesis protein